VGGGGGDSETMQTITPLKPTIPATAQRDPQPTTPWVKCSPLPPAPPLLSSMDLTANDPVLHHPSTSLTVSISIITSDAQSQLVIGSKTLSARLPTNEVSNQVLSLVLSSLRIKHTSTCHAFQVRDHDRTSLYAR